MLLLFLAGIIVGSNCAVDYQNVSAVRKHYAPSKEAVTDWLKGSTARGSSFTSVYTKTTDWYDGDTNDFLYRDVFQSVYKISRSGTVVALPAGDWKVEKEFTYNGADSKVLHGKLVTVKIKICAPNDTKAPSQMQCERTVRNLAESGMAIPKSAGKGGHLQPLKRLAKKRFGASNVDVIYNGCSNCRLKFLLFDCDKDKEMKDVRTMMFDAERPVRGAHNPVEQDHSSDVMNFGRDRVPDFHKRARRQSYLYE